MKLTQHHTAAGFSALRTVLARKTRNVDVRAHQKTSDLLLAAATGADSVESLVECLRACEDALVSARHAIEFDAITAD